MQRKIFNPKLLTKIQKKKKSRDNYSSNTYLRRERKKNVINY